MLTSPVNFHINPMCCNHFTKLKPITRLTHSFSTKGIFCLYREGMLLGANSKTLLNELAHTGDSTGQHCSSYVGTRSVIKLLRRSAFESVQCGLAQFMFCQELLLGLTKVMWWERSLHMVCRMISEEKGGKLYQFCPVHMGRSWCLVVSRCKPGQTEKPQQQHHNCCCTVEAIQSCQRVAKVTN